MKLRKPTPVIQVDKTTRTVKISHSQSVRQSMNYNSAESSYGAELTVPLDDKEIAEGIQRVEQIVEDGLTSKFAEQRNLLRELAKDRK